MAVVAPTSVTASKVDDTRAIVSWANDASWTGVNIDRWDSYSNQWTFQTRMSGVTSWTDTSLQEDRQYQYRVRGYGSTGESASTYSGYITTSPLPPISITLERSGTDIIITFIKGSTLAASSVYRYSTDSGATWSAQTDLAVGVLSTTLSGTDPALPYTVQLAGVFDSVQGPWSAGTGISDLSAPAVATNLTPGNLGHVVAGAPVPASWRFNPVDGTAMTAYEVFYTINGGALVDSGKITATTPTFSFPALAAGDVVDWQVQTWGAAADPSPLNDPPAEFSAANAPVVAIVSPADGGTVDQSMLSVGFTYTGDDPMAGGSVAVYDGAGTVQLGLNNFTGTSTTQPLPVALVNGVTDQIQVQAYDAYGLASNVAVSTVNVVYTPPPQPSLTIEVTDGGGSLTITVVNPDPGSGTAAVSNMLYRKIGSGPWELLDNSLEPNTGYIDYTAPTAGAVTYRATAVSGAPTYSAIGDVTINLKPAFDAEYIWLSAGPGYSLLGRFRGSPDVKVTHEKDKVLRTFFNRTLPVSYTGHATIHDIEFSGIIEGNDEMSTEARLTDIQNWEGTVMYRDAWGRRVFGYMEKASFTQQPFNLQKFSSKLTRAKDGR